MGGYKQYTPNKCRKTSKIKNIVFLKKTRHVYESGFCREIEQWKLHASVRACVCVCLHVHMYVQTHTFISWYPWDTGFRIPHTPKSTDAQVCEAQVSACNLRPASVCEIIAKLLTILNVASEDHFGAVGVGRHTVCGVLGFYCLEFSRI